MNVTMFVLYTMLLVMLYYNIRVKSKKVAILNIVLILTTLIITWFYNGTFLSRCINDYQFEVEVKHNYEILNLGYTIFPYGFYFLILIFLAISSIIVMGIGNVIKHKENDTTLIRNILFSTLVIYIISRFFLLLVEGSSRNNIPITYTEEMIAHEIKMAQILIHFGIFTNILASNLFILINFKNKKENVSDVKGENS